MSIWNKKSEWAATELPPIEYQRCIDCGDIFPFSEFYTTQGAPMKNCKSCRNKGSVINLTHSQYDKIAFKNDSTLYFLKDDNSWNTFTTTASYPQHFVPKYHNCPNCMAPVTDDKCAYCGTKGLYHYE